jgi:tetratricopeptide (TPR) repeat protein
MQQPIFHPSTELSNDDKVGQLLKKISRNILVIVAGLFPILFLPLPFIAVGYTKYLILILGVALAVIFYFLASLREGRLDVNLQWGIVALWGVSAVTFAAAAFSGDFYDSVFSDGLSGSSAIFVAALAFIVSAMGILSSSKQSTFRLFTLMALSALLLALFQIVKVMLGEGAISLTQLSSGTSSLLGDWNSLAIFFGLVILLSLVALEQLPLSKASKLTLVALSVVSLLILMLVNFKVVWTILLAVSFMILLYGLVRHRFTNPQLQMIDESADSIYSIVVSLAVLIISLGFVLSGSLFGSYVANLTGINFVEVRPSTTATIDIARNVLKEDPLLGIGPNRFTDGWRLYKNPAINETVFWGTNFDVGSSYFLTNLIQTGIIGALAWLVFFITLIMAAAKILLRTLRVDTFWYFTGVASIVAVVYLWGITLFYVPHPVILLFTAIFTGIFFAAYQVLVPGPTYSISIEKNRNFGFVLIAVVVLALTASCGGVYLVAKQFVANQQFNQSISSIKPGDTIDALEQKIASSYLLTNNDLFVRQIAAYQLYQINSLIRLTEPTEMERGAFETSVSKGIQAVNLATSLDATEPLNWQVSGQIHSALLFAGVKEAYEISKTAFNKAVELDPINPVLPLLLAELEVRNGNLTEARALAEKAVALRPQYTEAIYLLVQIDALEGKVAEAIAKTQNLIQLEPQNPARWYQLGILYATNKQLKEAVASFEQAAELNPQYANARYFLALGYYELGRSEDAQREFQAVLDLNPNNTVVSDLITRIKNGEPLTQTIVETNPVPESGEPNAATDNINNEDVESDLVTSVNNIPEAETTETTENAEAPTEDTPSDETTQ